MYIIPEEKTCSKCKNTKPLSEFNTDKFKKSGFTSQCKACRSESSAKWRKNNPEKVKATDQRRLANPEYKIIKAARMRKWRADNLELARAKDRQRRQNDLEGFRAYDKEIRLRNLDKYLLREREQYVKHKPKRLARSRRYNLLNKEKITEIRKAWRRTNAEYVRDYGRQYARKWRAANPEKVAERDRLRKAREARAEGSYTKLQWIFLCIKYDYKCLCCHKHLPLEPDHIVPLSRGGSNFISNIQPLCRSCNASKGSKTIDYR